MKKSKRVILIRIFENRLAERTFSLKKRDVRREGVGYESYNFPKIPFFQPERIKEKKGEERKV